MVCVLHCGAGLSGRTFKRISNVEIGSEEIGLRIVSDVGSNKVILQVQFDECLVGLQSQGEGASALAPDPVVCQR